MAQQNEGLTYDCGNTARLGEENLGFSLKHRSNSLWDLGEVVSIHWASISSLVEREEALYVSF